MSEHVISDNVTKLKVPKYFVEKIRGCAAKTTQGNFAFRNSFVRKPVTSILV